jgi:medium-chain acyl-[acyl-carrier-protein] hydrolase
MTTPSCCYPWLAAKHRHNQTCLRLFCFPYAGGGASIYRQWQTQMIDGIDVCPVQLPGREGRIEEPPCSDMRRLIKEMAYHLKAFFTAPFALFGHSMGGMIAYELARYLSNGPGAFPVHLFISASFPPHMLKQQSLVHRLPEAEFADMMERRGGMPKPILQNEEFRKLVLPILRADFALVENASHDNHGTLDIPFTVLSGDEDSSLSPETIDGWRGYTQGQFTRKLVPGDHFFINSARSAVIKTINATLSQYCQFYRQ